MDAEGLQPFLIGIEAALNSRPINKDDEDETLTPAHFLTGGRLPTIPQGTEHVRTQSLTRGFQLHHRLTEVFGDVGKGSIFSNHEVRKPARLSTKLKLGDIFLLQEERMTRQMWKKARIDELIPGRDCLIRTVKLRLPDRTKISRPVQLVIPLEIDQSGEDVED